MAAKDRRCAQHGFTLVEVVVAFALAAILFASLMTIVAPAYRMYQRTRAQSDGQLIAGNLLDTIRTATMGVTDLTVTDGESGTTVNVGRRNAFTVTAQDGLCFNGTAVYDKKYYNGKTVEMNGEQLGDNIIRLAVIVSGGNMPDSTTAVAIIAPMRRVLETQAATAAGDLQARAQKVKQDHAGEDASALFNTLYDDGAGGNTGFETFDLTKILPKAQLDALLAAAKGEKGNEAERELLQKLVDATDVGATVTYRLAVYYTANTLLPITYVTDADQSENNVPRDVYFIYYDGKWYVRNPNYLRPNMLTQFDSYSNTDLVNYFNAQVQFVPVSNWTIPMPRPAAVTP